MKILLFVALVLACALALIWAARKSARKDEAALRQNARARREREDLLKTPASYLLANRDDVWRTKREKAGQFDPATSRYARGPDVSGKTAYGGKSPHDVVVGTAHIRKEERVDEPSVTTIDHQEKQARK